MNLRESRLSCDLFEYPKPYAPEGSEALKQGALVDLGLVGELCDGRMGLTKTGRATLALLSLPDPGEPEQLPLHPFKHLVRALRWTVEDTTIDLAEWDDRGVQLTLTGRTPLAPDIWMHIASALLAAHAKAAEWRAERGVK